MDKIFPKFSKALSCFLTFLLLLQFFYFVVPKPQEAKADTFDPSQISGLKLWLDASVGVTKDGSTPAVDGDTVKQWNDRSSGGYNATQSTTSSRPTYKTNIMNGNPVLRFAGASNIVTTSFLDASFNTSFTFFIVKTKISSPIKCDTGNNVFTWFSAGANDSLYANMGNLSPTSLIIPKNGTQAITNPTIETYRYNGVQSLIRFNGISKVGSATGNLGLSGSLTIGSLSDNTYYYDGDIAEIIIYNSVLSGIQIDQVESYLMTKYAIVSGLPISIPLFIFDGDSMTTGYGADTGYDYPSQVQGLLGLTATYQNLGVPGQTVLQMSNDASTQIDIEYSDSRTINILTLLGGVNDLAGSPPRQDATTTYNRIVDYCQNRRAAGFKVIVNTILPQSATVGPVDYEMSRQIINSLIRTNWPTFADGISDIASDTRIGDAGDSEDTTYYADKIHMTNVGYGIVASYVTAAINKIIRPVASTIGAPTILSSNSIRWNFTDNADNETGFRVYTNTDAIATSSATANLTYLDETGLSENTQYTRYVKAYNSYGESASSSATSTYTLVDTPTNLTTADTTNQSITVSVDTFPNPTSGLSGYYFSQGSHNSGWIQTNSWQDSGLGCSNNYTYSVKYRNGNGAETSAISQTFRTPNCAGSVIITPQISQPTLQQTNITQSQSQQPTQSTSNPIPNIPATFSFQAGAKQGSINQSIKYLQIILNQALDTQLAKAGVGSSGKETNYFGSLTKQAVIKFQEKYKDEILKPWGLTKGTGIIGKTTKAKLNQLLGK
jgi:lysophospholipase L1-like esterase